MHFLQMLLNKGQYNGQQYLSEASIAEFRKIYTENAPVRTVAKGFEGVGYTLGGWAIEAKDHQAEAMAVPGLQGTVSVIDWCRGYAYLLLTKTNQDEPKRALYDNYKSAIDERMARKCN
jgi:hypothetical protein